MFGGGRKNALDSMLEITNEIIWAIQNGGVGRRKHEHVSFDQVRQVKYLGYLLLRELI